MRLSNLAALLFFSFAASAANGDQRNVSYGVLSATGTRAVIDVRGNVGASITIPAGLKGTLKLQTAYDGVGSSSTSMWIDVLGASPLFLTNTSTAVTASFPIDPGAIHVQAVVTTYATGTVTAMLRASDSFGAQATKVQATATFNVAGDSVVVPVDPSKWGYYMVSSPQGLNASTTIQYTHDNGVSWLTAPWIRFLSAGVQATPYSPTSSLATSTAALAQWELPLPGNATHVRVTSTAISATGTISLMPWRPYTPGGVSAILYKNITDTGGVYRLSFSGDGGRAWNNISTFLSHRPASASLPQMTPLVRCQPSRADLFGRLVVRRQRLIRCRRVTRAISERTRLPGLDR